MAKQKEETLPKTVFVYREKDGDSTYLVASESRAELADGEVRLVGTYRLVNLLKMNRQSRWFRFGRQLGFYR